MAKVGKPPIFKSVKAMESAIDAYFAECADQERPLTITGLAMALGMTTETLRAYGKKDEYSATVKRAKQFVERFLEERLLSGANATGPIFNLKNNFGWKDKVEQEHSGTINWPIPPSPREL